MPTPTAEPFGTHEGREVRLWRLAQDTLIGRVEIAVAEYGATLVSCLVPGPDGRARDIVLGYDRLEDYVAGRAFLGATVGRCANRLRGARASIEGRVVELEANEGRNQLHGGPAGFDKRVWEAAPDGDVGLRLAYRSPDGEMGYPGALGVTVAYRIERSGGLSIDMTAATDAPTLCNVVQHAYWNLAGHEAGSVLDHVARFEAAFHTPVDDELLATGEIRSVDGTPFDFRAPKAIGRDVEALPRGAAGFEGGGYDHNLVLGLPGPDGLRECCEIVSPRSRIGLRLRTSEPGVQFYAGGYLAGVVGKSGARYDPCSGFTLETQKFPCAPDFAHFPSALLRPGEAYRHAMRFAFFHA